LLTEIFGQLLENFPPGTRNDHNSTMLTSEFFEIVNDHAPGLVSQTTLSLILKEKGYISLYDRDTRSFAWLIKR